MTPHFKFFAKRVLRLKGDDLDDVLQELSCLAFDLYRALVEKGKTIYYSPLIRYAILRYRDGRRFAGSNSTDVLADRTQLVGRSMVKRGDTLHFTLDRKTNVAQSVGFKIDFADWYRKQSAKDRSIILALAMGHSPSDVARQHKQSPAAVTYRRRYYESSWKDYTKDNFQGGIASYPTRS
jgi:hypothetical protein